MQLRFALPIFAAMLTGAAGAELRLPAMLSDHAVLQREAPVHLWGWSNPDERVTVTFHTQTLSATADDLGRWDVWLSPERPGGPFTLTVKADSSTLTRSDILVGDVWFASGQSNMEMPLAGFPNSAELKDGPAEIARATMPGLRLLHIHRKSSEFPLEDQDATWTECVPATAADFSAVAYFFGRAIHEDEHVPVGLIDSTWGGTPAVAWTSLDAISADSSLMPEFADRARVMDSEADVPALKAREAREDAAAKQAGAPAPKHPWHPAPEMYSPAGLYNGMVAPAVDYTIKGVLWYQGETDSSARRAPLYERMFPTLITDWRSHWHQGEFPFLFVQLSSFTSTPQESWGIVREAQRRTLKLRNTAMAVTLDVGTPDNVHPPDKQTVGLRLALAARAMVYGEAVEFSGPALEEVTREGDSLRAWFKHAAGLNAKGSTLEGFEVAGDDRQFKPASARIEGATIVAHASGVAQPKYLRYAWANAPTSANLYNSAGLPAGTFTSEDRIPSPCPGNCPD
jgi:sialate O-acetylesterase